MLVSTMTRMTDGAEPAPKVNRTCNEEAAKPLDFLVNALDRAVARKRAAGTNETDHRT